jgi:putative MATE family efflux protein
VADSPLKSILKTSVPAVVDLSSQTIMWTIEAIFIGQLGAAAFAGVGMAIQVIILFMTVLLTFVVGSSLIITRYLGAGNRWEANHILGQAMMVGIAIAVSLTFFWYFGATQIFKLIQEDNNSGAEQAGVTYLKTVAIFAPFIITNFIALGIVRGSGDTKYSMMINVGVNTLNLLLAPLLIFGLLGLPELKVRGAALAVGISHTLGFAATMLLLRSRKAVLFLSFRELTTPNLASFKRLFRAGLPTTIEQLVWAFGQLVISGYAAVISVTVLAAHQAFMRIQAVLSMFYMGFGMGAMTLMGKNLGADRRRLAELTAKMTGWVVFVFVMSVVAILFIFSGSVISIFTSDEKVIALGSFVLRIFAVVQIPKAVNGVLMGNLRGAGDLNWLMWLSILSVAILEVGLNWFVVFVLNLSLTGLWLVQFCDESLRLALNYWRFRGGKWKFLHI